MTDQKPSERTLERAKVIGDAFLADMKRRHPKLELPDADTQWRTTTSALLEATGELLDEQAATIAALTKRVEKEAEERVYDRKFTGEGDQELAYELVEARKSIAALTNRVTELEKNLEGAGGDTRSQPYLEGVGGVPRRKTLARVRVRRGVQRGLFGKRSSQAATAQEMVEPNA